jgi:hypothetical protein
MAVAPAMSDTAVAIPATAAVRLQLSGFEASSLTRSSSCDFSPHCLLTVRPIGLGATDFVSAAPDSWNSLWPQVACHAAVLECAVQPTSTLRSARMAGRLQQPSH